MKKIRRCLAVSVGACSFLLALSVSAQPRPSSPPAAYTYDFEPDDLIGETLSTTPPLLRVRPTPPRVTLLRPRASFVAEMFKSVEVL
jgi:hypothetical protein